MEDKARKVDKLFLFLVAIVLIDAELECRLSLADF